MKNFMQLQTNEAHYESGTNEEHYAAANKWNKMQLQTFEAHYANANK